MDLTEALKAKKHVQTSSTSFSGDQLLQNGLDAQVFQEMMGTPANCWGFELGFKEAVWDKVGQNSPPSGQILISHWVISDST